MEKQFQLSSSLTSHQFVKKKTNIFPLYGNRNYRFFKPNTAKKYPNIDTKLSMKDASNMLSNASLFLCYKLTCLPNAPKDRMTSIHSTRSFALCAADGEQNKKRELSVTDILQQWNNFLVKHSSRPVDSQRTN